MTDKVRDYIMALIELDTLVVLGKEDSEEYDSLLDKMDVLWYGLSEEECSEIRKIVGPEKIDICWLMGGRSHEILEEKVKKQIGNHYNKGEG